MSCCQGCRTLAVLPALFAVLCFSTMFVIYIVSTQVDKVVYPWIPAIGETHDKSPERNFFGQFFNMCSFLLLVIIFVRFLQLKHDADWNEESRPLVLKLNQAGLLFGGLGALGASIVANFQAASPDESVKSIHLVGAAMMLLCAVSYCWIQTIICYKMKLCGLNSACLFNARAAFTITVSVFGVICVVFRGFAEERWNTVAHNKTTGEWDAQDPGFVSHVLSNTMEWVVAVIMLIFFLTFVGEFKSMKVKLLVSRRNPLPSPLSVSEESMRTPLLL